MESRNLDIILKRLYVAKGEDGGDRLSFDVDVVQEAELYRDVHNWSTKICEVDSPSDVKEDMGPLRGCFISDVDPVNADPRIVQFKIMFDHVVFEDVEASRISGGFFRINDNVKFCAVPTKALPFQCAGITKMCVYSIDFEGVVL